MDGKISLWINGRLIEVDDADVSLTLAAFLRKSGNTGTKLACEVGGCGSCTVALQTRPEDAPVAVNACLTRLASLHGASVTTVEGLVKGESLHPVQERLYKGHGSQCGFCTPGMVMSMYGALQKSQGLPDIEDIKTSIQGNLCRCTGYGPILEAFETFCPKEKIPQRLPSKCKDYEEVLKLGENEFKAYNHSEDNPEKPCKTQMEKLNSQQKVLMMDNGYKWYKPITLKEALKIMDKSKSFQFHSGGTGGHISNTSTYQGDIIQINHISELNFTKVESNNIEIGAGVTLTGLETLLKQLKTDSTFVASLIKALSTLASPQVRNVATIGGHLGWAHRASDLMPIFLAHGNCKVNVVDKRNKVKPLLMDREFTIKPGGLIKSIIIPLDVPRMGFYRMAMRQEFALAGINVAFKEEGSDLIKMAIGGLDMKQTLVSIKKPSELTLDGCRTVIVDIQENGFKSSLRLDTLAKFIHQFLHDENEENHKRRSSKLTFQKPNADQPDWDSVERPIPHLWAAEQATGAAKYVNDLPKLSNELVLTLVLSTKAHANIKSMDFKKALAMDDVVETISYHDLKPEKNAFGLIADDEAVFAGPEVKYFGQPIAGILSESEKVGREAAKLVDIQYEDLPSVLSIKEARAKEKYLISLDMNKVQKTSKSDSSLKGTIHMSGQDHFYMETQRALVIPHGEKDELTVHVSTQGPTAAQAKIAHVLGVPMHKIVVKAKRVGGGFGGKERPHIALMAAVAAKKVGRPVRLVLNRAEDMAMTGHRHEVDFDYEVGFKSNGKIVDMKCELFANAGCSLDLSPPWIGLFLMRCDSGYTLEAFKGKAHACDTNLPSNTAMRGFGGPEGMIAMEEVIEKIAVKLGKDPLSIRRVNLTKDGDEIHAGDGKLKGVTVEKCFEECLLRGDYEDKKRQVAEFNAKHDNVKLGLSVLPMKFGPAMGPGFVNQGAALVRVYTDGSVLVTHGGIEMGQGLNTKMLQVASRALGVPMSKVHSLETSTETVPNSSSTGGSTGSDLYGPAVINACEVLKKRLKPYMKKEGENWEAAVLKAYMDRVNLSAVGFYDSHPVNWDLMTNKGVATGYYTCGAGLALVQVDCVTGRVKVLSAELVLDLGRSLNPAIDIGQIEGAFVQGLGYVTTEQLLNDSKTGRLLTDSPHTYKIPTVADIPEHIGVSLLGHKKGEPTSACYSSKGVGEPPFSIGAAGVYVAVRSALVEYRRQRGLDIQDFSLSVPATPDRVRAVAIGQERRLFEDNVAVEI